MGAFFSLVASHALATNPLGPPAASRHGTIFPLPQHDGRRHMSWLVIASLSVIFVLIHLTPSLVLRLLIKYDIKKQIRMKTRVGNLWYVINWVIVVGWIGLFSYISITQVDNWLSVGGIVCNCMMTIITVMLIRELHQSYKSRHYA